MSKTLVLGVALSLVLVSGAFFSARADCGCFHWPSCLSLCNFQLPSLCCGSGNVADRDRADRDMDQAKINAPHAGPYSYDYNSKHGIAADFGQDKVGTRSTF